MPSARFTGFARTVCRRGLAGSDQHGDRRHRRGNHRLADAPGSTRWIQWRSSMRCASRFATTPRSSAKPSIWRWRFSPMAVVTSWASGLRRPRAPSFGPRPYDRSTRPRPPTPPARRLTRSNAAAGARGFRPSSRPGDAPGRTCYPFSPSCRSHAPLDYARPSLACGDDPVCRLASGPVRCASHVKCRAWTLPHAHRGQRALHAKNLTLPARIRAWAINRHPVLKAMVAWPASSSSRVSTSADRGRILSVLSLRCSVPPCLPFLFFSVPSVTSQAPQSASASAHVAHAVAAVEIHWLTPNGKPLSKYA